ncbi:MAG: 16S rRNA (adenine(1518)-N(6)/adenine(1519)-N(6))-dimethyltransferase RsmA [Candidatus Omnitrophica bacterium]|nr:16S rRNA (adenine(1518)-N(6)/adenine(1519)-N(6))-dimethyltransferase RsmA [Candidatus Omnitrophota bacterium]
MHIKPKKRLGQNFLIDKNIRNKIIYALGLKPSDIVLEIGPGKGELTRIIAGFVNHVYAVEIDTVLSNLLNENLSDLKSISIINKDILKLNIEEIFAKHKQKIKVFGNIPYYISSPIIEKLIDSRDFISEAFLTVQKEFAERIIASPGTKDYGSFSCFVQYFTEPKIMFKISRNCFFPVPKVDSSLVLLKTRQVPPVHLNEEGRFFKIIRAAFNKRRKTLRNSLENVVSKELLLHFFKEFNIDENTRPESLSLNDFANLSNLKNN